jgi:hypothetical protein
MTSEQVLREQLIQMLRSKNAHMSLESAVADFPMEAINTRAPNVPYTPWHLLEHIRIAQWDILEFVRDPKHVSPPWPKGYWPDQNVIADPSDWEKTLQSYRSDLDALEELARDPKTDLFTPIPHGDGQNILREILTVSDHNAYHTGEFAILRQVMGTWPKNKK